MGVEVRESMFSRCRLLGTFTAANGVGVEGGTEGARAECAFTAVKPPEFTGMKPDGMAGRGSSEGGVGATSL